MEKELEVVLQTDCEDRKYICRVLMLEPSLTFGRFDWATATKASCSPAARLGSASTSDSAPSNTVHQVHSSIFRSALTQCFAMSKTWNWRSGQTSGPAVSHSPPSSNPEPSTSSIILSPRTDSETDLDRLIEMHFWRDFATGVEAEIEASKDHWTELSEPAIPRSPEQIAETNREIEASKDHWTELSEPAVPRSAEQIAETNREVFLYLQMLWGPLFCEDLRKYGLELGPKLAEGGQAEIFETHQYEIGEADPSEGESDYVLKLFKDGSSLLDLLKDFPMGLPSQLRNRHFGTPVCLIHGGVLLDDGKFAFLMERYHSDLRKVIDLKMQHNHNQHPPFDAVIALWCMLEIAKGMAHLHYKNFLHRDLKAANVLVDETPETYLCYVADHETSGATLGTRNWRAPEILAHIKNQDIESIVYTKEADVYSYAMTCYEILTGCIPFEDLPATAYYVVLRGDRPELPGNIDPSLKELLNRCWHSEPGSRPTFDEITLELHDISGGLPWSLKDC